MSKKIKGTKVDLATFNEDTSASTAPTFPNRSTQSRENGNRFSTLDDGPNDYRGGGDRGGGFRGGGDDGGFGGMPESVADGDNNWRKAAPSGGTNFIRPQGGGFGGDRGGGFGGDRGGGDRGGGFGGDRGGGFGGDRGGGFGGDRGRGGPDRYEDTSNAERPRLNLAPRSAGAGGARPILSTAASTATENGDDKWSTVFKNSASIGSNRGAGGGAGGGGSNLGSAGGFYRSSRDEPVDDPRFAGKFSGGGGGARFSDGRRDGGRGGYDRSNERGPIPLPTAPRGVLEAPVAPRAAIPQGPSEADLKAIEDAKAAKAAKAAKKAERLAAEKAAQEAKVAALIAEKERKEKEAAVAGTAATALISSGLKGTALVESAKSSSGITGAAVLKEILMQSADVLSSKWWTNEEYGEVLSILLAGSEKNEVAALYSVQFYCAEKKFPKAKVDGVTKKVIEALFSILLSNKIIDGESFVAWADDEDGSESVGRLDAIVQTTSLLNSIRDALLGEDSEEEEEEEEEIDAPREFV